MRACGERLTRVTLATVPRAMTEKIALGWGGMRLGTKTSRELGRTSKPWPDPTASRRALVLPDILQQ